MAQGTLYLCATPIGNLGDMSPRIRETLSQVDLIACEDTRNSIRLLNHFEIHTPMTSYHEYNRVEKAKVLVKQLQEGKNIALITDAGTPGISDPGEELVRQCHEAGITVTALPGACALINALIISGQPTRRFCFEAFLPSDKQERRDVISELENETRTMIIYEAPHRLKKTLAELTEVFGADRRLSVCKELTKRHENVFLTTFGEVVEFYENNEPRGEYVLVIEGKSRDDIKKEQQAQWESMSIVEHVDKYIADGMDKKEAMKAAAKDRGISKREVYNEYVK